MTNTVKIHPFNNKVETGLRTLTILYVAYPKPLDIDTLVYFDYLTIHCGDFSDELASLHPPVERRKGEIAIRRTLIQESIELFQKNHMIDKKFTSEGIKYIASEEAAPFVENLSTKYFVELEKRARWVVSKFLNIDTQTLSTYMSKYMASGNQSYKINLVDNE